MSSKSSGVRYRSAKTGEFVTQSKAKRNPSTTVSERVGGGPTGRSRSAKDGQFVKDSYARRNPNTTVTES